MTELDRNDLPFQSTLLEDIEISEQQEANGETFTQDEVEKMTDEWLK